MFKRFYPSKVADSTYQIDFQQFYNEGYRGVLFDIDNTLVPHGAKADENVILFFQKLHQIGFKYCLMSNNKKERVETFNEMIKAPCIYKANKPFKESYLKGMKLMGTTKKETLFVGDQLFTDVFGAKRLGIYNILVKPINPKEEIQIVLKRYLERVVLFFYNRKNK